MKATKISNDIYWVGAIDWDLRNFHGYLTQRGTTYNAYLIIDEKITLVDTVKAGFTDELIERIRSIVDPSKIDYVISNHVEMDHSGAVPEIMKFTPNATVVVSPNGEKGLKEHYKANWKFLAMKTGDSLNIGKRTIQFINTPMVHWPDNMICYLPEDKILFSNDSLGQHYASSGRFDDECPIDIVMEEAKKYYANIVLPYSSQVLKEYEAIKNLEINLIATSHGVIWRKHIREIINNYVDWVQNKTRKKALIVYDSMWGSTEILAYKVIAEVFENAGYQTEMMNLQVNHISDIMTNFMDAEYVCVGSPTLNNTLMPNVAAFLTYLRGLSPKGRKAIAFGSYGWGGQSIAHIEKYFEESGFKLVHSIKCKYIPSEDTLTQLKDELSNSIKQPE